MHLMQAAMQWLKGDAAKATLLKQSKWRHVICITMEEVVQLPVFVCTDNPSIVNGVVQNMYVGK